MTREEFLRLARVHPVAAAIKAEEDWTPALESRACLLFARHGDAFALEPLVEQAHARGKGVVAHLDLLAGIGKDRAGLAYLRHIGLDAVITSRPSLVGIARAEGLLTIQPLLLTEELALTSCIHQIAQAQPDLIEVLPGIIFPDFARTVRALLPGPFIAGGFIRTPQEVARLLATGCVLISSSARQLWQAAA
ncbi:glycerol-3-phosphate responsive antiterminator [Thermogemmatispora carboxidivorans]|uniref:glycerol-3-phosphate responsive antiterminator n=1 Tax=Thermogemmatispora carboxidivorans TaxID=1382306 RepID=UPI00069A5D31|nr:glycerol-3-phosphate responsive antiterminator [Thermogemmatispora carboxidivorans]